MIWEGTRDIEEANQAAGLGQTENPDQTEAFGQIEDDASETYSANDTRVVPPLCVGNTS